MTFDVALGQTEREKKLMETVSHLARMEGVRVSIEGIKRSGRGGSSADYFPGGRLQ